MARRRNRNKDHHDERETIDFATPVLRPPKKPVQFVNPTVYVPRSVKPKLNQIDDRRTFHPQKLSRPAKLVSGAPHRLKIKTGTRTPKSALPHSVGFSAPAKVLICIRRKTRKQVLFALKRTRKGSGSRKTRNYWSDVKC